MRNFKVIINTEFVTWVRAKSACDAGQQGISAFADWYNLVDIKTVEVFLV